MPRSKDCDNCSGEDCCCCPVWLEAQADMSPESQREAEEDYQESLYLDPYWDEDDEADWDEDDEDPEDEGSCYFDDEIRFEHDDGMG